MLSIPRCFVFVCFLLSVRFAMTLGRKDTGVAKWSELIDLTFVLVCVV